MKKLTEYMVLTSPHLGDLTEKVKSAMAEGWQPLGGMITIGDHSLGQTMVK